MKSERKSLLLRAKAMLAALSIVLTMSSCKNNDSEEEAVIQGAFYLVPYQNHIYMITDSHEILYYDYRIAGYEGGTNNHELRFYKFSGEEIGDGWLPEDVGYFHFENEEEMMKADEIVEAAGQTPISYYLNQLEDNDRGRIR